MKILYISEIVGKPGIFVLKNLLSKLKKKYQPDFTLGNGDGVTGGYGLGKNHAFYIHKLGLQAITGGDCYFYKKDLQEIIDPNNFLIRPANYPPGTPGRGFRFIKVGDQKLGVVSLLGQSSFSKIHLPSPLNTLEHILEKNRHETSFWVVDFHAATTAEKNTFFYAADGMVSAIFGSHQKVLTADSRILEKGTAVITDSGRTGSNLSVGGFLPQVEIHKFLTGVPEKSQDCWEGLELQGVLVDLDQFGKAKDISMVKEICEERPDAGDDR